MQLLVTLLLSSTLASIVGSTALLPPGLYRNSAGDDLYVGIQHEWPDPAANQAFDPATGRLSDAAKLASVKPVKTISESRSTIDTPEGRLGVSLYYDDDSRRTTIVLIHGADPETREMGYIIPYFVLHGVNVIAYDQRGTGDSTGDWLKSGPVQRAADVDSVIDHFSSDERVDSKRIGVWGFSNGGWTAPIVATERPIAFMILKSASAETVHENIYYEAKQRMLRYHESLSSIAAALGTWKTILDALSGNATWASANQSYAFAKRQPWFEHSLLSMLQLPLSPAAIQGWKTYTSYDPTSTLTKVTTPTLALFGDNDRSVDVKHAAPALERSFKSAGMQDFTLHMFAGASHTLALSKNGFTSDDPTRLAAGYPQIMIDWLERRGFLASSQAVH
jgi:hypothetical protein